MALDKAMERDFHLGEWLIQPSLGRATRNGNVVHLRAKVMDLLVYLADRHGQVVSKDVLLNGVWGTEALSESALTRSMTELRQALQDEVERPSLIETIPKRGYRVIASVQPIAPAAFSSSPIHSRKFLRRLPAPTWKLAAIAVALAPAATIGWSLLTGAGRTAERPVTRFVLHAPDGTTFASSPAAPYPAVSPNGRLIAVVASTPDARRHIWIYALDSISPRMLGGTDDADLPFWSPDGRYVAFFARGKLWKVPAAGGPLQSVSDAPEGFGATWSSHDEILFAPNAASGLFRISASGGQPVQVTNLDASREETSHRYPQFLPDGRHYIYLVKSKRLEHQGIYIGSLNSPTGKLITPTASNAVYIEPGYLLFVRNAILTAQAFDVRRLGLSGEALTLDDGVPAGGGLRYAPFSATRDALTYRAGGMLKTQLVWVDRQGRRIETIGAPGRYLTPSLSPDGRRLAVDAFGPDGRTVDTSVFDLQRGVATRLTFASSVDGYPLWAGDGVRLILASNRDDVWSFRMEEVSDRPAPAVVEEPVLLESPWSKHPQTWSSDGQSLVYVQRGERTGYDLWLLSLTGDRQPRPLVATPFHESQAQFSPDGRWLAYTSNESGRLEVYVRSFIGGATKVRVSLDGGCQPRWRADGKELYYLHGRALYAMPIETSPALKPGIPMELFETRAASNSSVTWDYVAAPDGQRFILKDVVYEDGGSSMIVVLNWEMLLRR